MKANVTPQFDSAWWKKNKAKGLSNADAKPVLDALVAFEKEPSCKSKESKLAGVVKAAKSVAEKCGGLQSETKAALLKYESEAKKMKKKLDWGANAKAAEIMKGSGSYEVLKKHAKDTFWPEALQFYETGQKSGEKRPKTDKECCATYLAFIREGSPKSVNVTGATRKKFTDLVIAKVGKNKANSIKYIELVDAKVDWGAAPWKKIFGENETRFLQHVGNFTATKVWVDWVLANKKMT